MGNCHIFMCRIRLSGCVSRFCCNEIKTHSQFYCFLPLMFFLSLFLSLSLSLSLSISISLSLWILSHFVRRDGLMKMKAAYEANPNMGDPNSVEGQLKENSHKMDKLQTELRKFVGYQDEMDGLSIPNNTPNVQKKSSQSSTHNNRNSIHSDQDSLSRSASDSSFCHNNQTQNQQSSKIRDSVTSQNFINHNHNSTNNHNNTNSHEQITTNNKINPVSPMSPKTNGLVWEDFFGHFFQNLFHNFFDFCFFITVVFLTSVSSLP